MKAVVARRGSDVPEVAEVPRQELGANQVRVAVSAAGFTYVDAFVPGHLDTLGLPEQVGLGFDFSGTVVEAGGAASRLAVGDRVAGLHTDITASVRAHAEELVVEESALAAVPEAIDLQVAAAIPLSSLTARQALDLLGEERGSLLITGAAGAVGGWLIELAARDGWSVTALVRPGTESAVATGTVITELAATYDAVLDAAALHAPALKAVRDGGRYVGFKPGQPQTPERGITVQTVVVHPDGSALAELLPLAAVGTVPIRIAGRSMLADAAAAYRSASTETGARGRWLLVP